MRTGRRVVVAGLGVLALLAVAWIVRMRGGDDGDEAMSLAARGCGPEASDGSVDELTRKLAPAGDRPVDAALRRSLAAAPPTVRDALGALGVVVFADDAGVAGHPCGASAGDGANGVLVGGCYTEGRAPGAQTVDRRLLLTTRSADGEASAADAATGPGTAGIVGPAVLPAVTHVFLRAVADPLATARAAGSYEAPDLGASLAGLEVALAGAAVTSASERRFYEARYGAGWSADPAALERVLLHVTDRFYCTKATRERLAASRPAVEQLYARTFQCMLGKPWYASEAEFKSACGGA
jgi:hypothetical protein